MKIKNIRVDESLYPRSSIDGQTVTRLLDVLRCDRALPPITVEAKTHRLVDGRHRLQAMRRFAGEDADIEVVEEKYATELTMFRRAIELNREHGLPLAPFDRALCITRMRKLGADDEVVRETLCLTAKALNTLVRNKLATYKGQEVPIKRTLGYLAGEKIGDQTMQVNERAGGMTPLFYVNQLLDLLRHNLLDRRNIRLVTALAELHAAIEKGDYVLEE